MSCTSSNLLLSPISNRTTRHVTAVSSYNPQSPKPAQNVSVQCNDQKTRRQLLFLMTAMTSVTTMERVSLAEDIGLFGLRKKIKKVEEEAEEIVKEGIETAEKGIEAAERGIEGAEKEIESDIDTGFGGGLGQAGVVLGAEAVAVFVASSVVNGILGPESN
uniref:uncharacterized protein LOC122579098 n=1 Tax=Erigeron canadensis TaxID=72917 RepID=UPI001CB96915|nr:uncharacterized protein LOC122579098 [Erigeron canadensis]